MLSEDDTPNRGETGLLLSLNVKFLGSVKRIRAAVRRLLAPLPVEEIVARLDVRCGGARPRNVYASFFELLRLAPEPWSPTEDISNGDGDFSYVVRGGVARLSPDVTIWTAPDVLEIDLTGPPNRNVEIALYMHEEPDWYSAFRRQDVWLGDLRLGPFHDFMGRGPDCAEGSWVRSSLQMPGAGLLPIRIRRLGGGDARISRLVVRDVA